EADEMLDAGFAHDVERIIGLTYSTQTVLASATIPDWVKTMIAKHLNDPVTIRLVAEGPSLLEHGLVRTDSGLKLRLLSDILRRQGAPALRTIDAAELSRQGGWLYIEDSTLTAPPAAAGMRSTGRRRRGVRGRGPRPVYRQAV